MITGESISFQFNFHIVSVLVLAVCHEKEGRRLERGKVLIFALITKNLSSLNIGKLLLWVVSRTWKPFSHYFSPSDSKGKVSSNH